MSSLDSAALRSQVFAYIAQIPPGRVTTYGELGRQLGINPRYVGRILHQNTDPDRFPCHRVIKSDGQIASGYAFGGPGIQQKLLESEGVVFTNGRVDLRRFGFDQFA